LWIEALENSLNACPAKADIPVQIVYVRPFAGFGRKVANQADNPEYADQGGRPFSAVRFKLKQANPEGLTTAEIGPIYRNIATEGAT
jgi:hypothetical protein